MRRLLPLLLLALSFSTAGCDVVEPGDDHKATWYVAPYKQGCQSFYMTDCLLVKERPQDQWQFFYGGIFGFEYEPGYNYQIVVAWRDVPNPPADGSSREYWLVELVEKTPAE